MTTTQPEVSLEGLYSQSQVAKALGVDRHTVKRYELAGQIKFKVRKAGGRPVTTGAQIVKCWRGTYL